jgi:hypothetical protein
LCKIFCITLGDNNETNKKAPFDLCIDTHQPVLLFYLWHSERSAYTRVFGSDDADTSSPGVLAGENLKDTLVWNCQVDDLREYLGENWENYPIDLQDLILDVKSTGDTFHYTLSFFDT